MADGGKGGLDPAAPTKPTGVAMIAAGLGAPAAQHVEEMEERGGGVADDDDGAGEAVAPQLEGGGGAGGDEALREIGDGGVVEGDDELVALRGGAR